MNFYLIYKFSEYADVFPMIKKFENEENNSNNLIFYFLPSDKEKYKDWRVIAEEKIANSDAVIYIRKNASKEYSEDDFDNITFEIKIAQKYQKNIIIVEIPEDGERKTETEEEVPSIIYEKDYSDSNCIKYKIIEELDIKSVKKALFNLDDILYNSQIIENEIQSRLLLEEYKIMINTSEKMMERRQGTNNFYITLCTAMLTVIVAFIATKINTIVWGSITFVISGMMMFLCYNWKKTLEAYGLSNEAKYEILNKIEENLPASIFFSEWEYGKTIDYSPYSQRESKIPEVFFCLFMLLALAMVGLIVLSVFNFIPLSLFGMK